jgi:DNA-binding GntR family transcriptional regulator
MTRAQSNKRMPLAEQAYQQIRLAIRKRQFRSGDRLRENELAEMFGLSRTPIREALSRLQAEGLAAQNAQRGFTIIEFDHAMVSELYVMRESLEGTAARLAARSADDAELGLLRTLHEEYSALFHAGNESELTEKNRQFHEVLCLCAHNRFLLRMLEPLHDALGLLGESNLVNPERARQNIVDHAGIVDALVRRDAQSAEDLVREHIRAAYAARIQRMFSSSKQHASQAI